MEKNNIDSFFDGLFEDEVEKKIIQLISEGLDPEKDIELIIQRLLGVE